MILDQHERALGEARVDAARCVGQHQDLDAQQAEHAHGKGDRLQVVPFVEMRAARQRRDVLPLAAADHERARVPDDVRRGPVRNVPVGAGHGLRDAIAKCPEARPQDDRHIRGAADSRAKVIRGVGDAIVGR